jgi:hypothetical protein
VGTLAAKKGGGQARERGSQVIVFDIEPNISLRERKQ